ncbi:MAG: hypothetical protein AAF610_08015 [Pseudomonadota bacterium]
MSWQRQYQALVSEDLSGQNDRLGFSFSTGSLIWLREWELVGELALDQKTDDDARRWCNRVLAEAGLRSTEDTDMPYTLAAPHYGALSNKGTLAALGDWYAETYRALGALIMRFGTLAVTTPVVRCWPHHFDMAALFSLDAGDPEHARSVGIGFSPGDDSFPDPYFYCTPWPAPDSRPAVALPWHWHTKGFTALVCPIGRLQSGDDFDERMISTFRLAKNTLKAK